MARKGRRRRVPRFFGITFRLVLIVAGICLLLSYASSYIDPAKFWVPMFFGLYFIPILAINLFLLIIALLSRSKSAWITIIVLLPSLLFAERFVRFGGGKETGAPKIKIETYNVGLFRLSKNKLTYNQTMDSIISQINKSDADIVCLQEVYFNNRQVAKTILPEYRWRAYHLISHKNGKQSGNIILSRYNIVNSHYIKFTKSTNLTVYADIAIGEDTLRVYNNHLQSYAISPTSLLKRIRSKKTFSEEMGNEIISVHNKFRNTVIQRSHQVNQVLDNMKKIKHPYVVCGDFNDIPMSYTYHKFASGRKDTFREAGRGFSASFSLLWPLFRIDYVFIPESFKGISHKTIRCNYSDHYPVVAEFSKE